MNANNDVEHCPPQPQLVGTTGSHYTGSIQSALRYDTLSLDGARSASPSLSPVPSDLPTLGTSNNFFKSLQWSPDGTTLLASSADNALRTFILPPTLLEPSDDGGGAHILRPYARHILPEPAYCAAIHPAFNLSEPASCLVIASLRGLPLRLVNALGGGLLASYPFVSPTTEAYIAPHSLLFDPSRTNEILAGSDGRVSVFDINRIGEGPVSTRHVGSTRRRRGVGGLGIGRGASGCMKGIVSALAMSGDGMLAAGTFGRTVGMYSDSGSGDGCEFSLRDDRPSIADEDISGAGVTQLLWGEEGRYLCVVERKSDGIGVWDVRSTGKRLAWLKGRKAKTQQRFSVDLFRGQIWAGGTDGMVRTWEQVGMQEGIQDSTWAFQAHDDAVSSVGLHSTGSVLATCSGQRHWPRLDQKSPNADLDTSSESESGTDTDTDSARSSSTGISSSSSVSKGKEIHDVGSPDSSVKAWAL